MPPRIGASSAQKAQLRAAKKELQRREHLAPKPKPVVEEASESPSGSPSSLGPQSGFGSELPGDAELELSEALQALAQQRARAEHAEALLLELQMSEQGSSSDRPVAVAEGEAEGEAPQGHTPPEQTEAKASLIKAPNAAAHARVLALEDQLQRVEAASQEALSHSRLSAEAARTKAEAARQQQLADMAAAVEQATATAEQKAAAELVVRVTHEREEASVAHESAVAELRAVHAREMSELIGTLSRKGSSASEVRRAAELAAAAKIRLASWEIASLGRHQIEMVHALTERMEGLLELSEAAVQQQQSFTDRLSARVPSREAALLELEEAMVAGVLKLQHRMQSASDEVNAALPHTRSAQKLCACASHALFTSCPCTAHLRSTVDFTHCELTWPVCIHALHPGERLA